MKGLILKSLFISFFTLLLLPKQTHASVGFVEMRSTIGEDTRCRADSHLMQNNNYQLLVTCQDLIYPATNVVTTYIVWATPTGGGEPLKLGPLEYGRVDLRSRVAFSALFVTPETKVGREPSGPVVLRGTLQPYTFLQRPTTPTPTPEEEESVGSEGDEQGEKGSEATENLTTRQKLVAAFKRAGLAAGLALIALIGLIFVVTRSRG